MISEMTPYDELSQMLEALPLLVRETRRRRAESLRQVSALTGVSYSTIKRLEAGEDVLLSAAKALLVYVARY